MNAAERVARKIQHDNGPEVRVVAGTRHYKIVVRGRLAGILPYPCAASCGGLGSPCPDLDSCQGLVRYFDVRQRSTEAAVVTEYEHHLRTRGTDPAHPTTDTADLDAAGQFKRYFHGPRIKVKGPMGTRFGQVSMTAGWRPAFLLMHRSSDSGSYDVLGPEDKIVAVQYGHHYVPAENIPELAS